MILFLTNIHIFSMFSLHYMTGLLGGKEEKQEEPDQGKDQVIDLENPPLSQDDLEKAQLEEVVVIPDS